MLSVAILIMYKQEKQSVYDAMLYIMTQSSHLIWG